MDTATRTLAVALGQGEVPLASAALTVPRGHSRWLQPALANLLRVAGVAAGGVEEVVAGIGPGSYTGVRLGVTTAKAMAFALGIPLRPVSTLWALAEAALPVPAPRPRCVLPLLYARRERAFGALYRKRGEVWEEVWPVAVRPLSEWLAAAAALAEEVCWVHDLAGEQVALLAGAVGECWPLEAVAAGLGPALLRLARQPGVPVLTGQAVHRLTPEYALPVQAEVQWAARQAETGGDGGGHG
ncbi:MAG: tRNA (adenosine(37)-N6)-threonylcarbamoyltransferase complex dimerization subunit type 1 TsaB [Alicyclobacillus sp.]|nr:tRNA (adenosine(37)-N6)-threonylcarbamoyltransferase complex dimerization subunit type 1 TsaB [Alicyclobacillus sp.]